MLRGLSAAVFIAGRGVPGCGSPLLRDRKAAAVIYPPLLPNPIKWRSSGPGRRGAGGREGVAGRTGPRRGGQTAPQRVADLPLFTTAAFFLFFYGGLVSSSRLSRAASKHPKPDSRASGLGRPCSRLLGSSGPACTQRPAPALVLENPRPPPPGEGRAKGH